MGVSAETLNNLNKETKNIFNSIQKKGPLTKSQLLLMTDMKLTTLNRFMQTLEESRLVVESDVGESTGGRKPVLYDVNTHGFYVIGIDISRTYTQVVIANLKMDILAVQRFAMTEEYSPQRTVEAVSQIIDDFLKELFIDRYMVLGAGVSTVGPMDRKRGIMTNPRDFLSRCWMGAAIKDMFQDVLGVPVVIDNGANTAVLAEYFYGDGRSLESMAYFNCGIGIRTGVISSGRIVRAINDAEDAFGHMVIDVDGEPCGCGNYGCLECYSSIPSIVKKFKSLIKKGRTTSVSMALEDIDYTHICAAAEEGDDTAREVVVDAAAVFGAGLANYINLLSPRLVILSGPLVGCSELFYRVSIGVASKKHYMREENRIVFSRGGYFKNDAMAVGAAAMVFENILNMTV